tara:strand:- start:740 stop:901 length:162 start_codon:yes stop_codon:yes gene_type:complete
MDDYQYRSIMERLDVIEARIRRIEDMYVKNQKNAEEMKKTAKTLLGSFKNAKD